MGSHVADYSKATDPKNHFFYQMAAPSRCQVVLVVSSALQKDTSLLERRMRAKFQSMVTSPVIMIIDSVLFEFILVTLLNQMIDKSC